MNDFCSDSSILLRLGIVEQELRRAIRATDTHGAHSIGDLNLSFEKYARDVIQRKFQLLFQSIACDLMTEDKELKDPDTFKRIGPYIKKRSEQLDIYFGVISPLVWATPTEPVESVMCVQGTFELAAASLEDQRKFETKRHSPTTNSFPKIFQYYALFEVSTGSQFHEKLNQIEAQMQYIICRDFTRQEKQFPPVEFARVAKEPYPDTKRREYNNFIGVQCLRTVAYCGLVFSFPSNESIKSKLLKLINENEIDLPCACSMLKASRFFYVTSVTMATRVESLEKMSSENQSRSAFLPDESEF